jgi:hypothetical protein
MTSYLHCFLTSALIIFYSVIVNRCCYSQDLEPRRWNHVPKNTNFFGAAYGYTKADIGVDPTLRLEDVELDLHTLGVKYIRTFELLEKSARVELISLYQDAQWEGLLDGSPRTAKRNGFGDPAVRFAINLLGAPPLSGNDYVDYRRSIDRETIVGAGLEILLPLGEYFEDKLLNLGGNRFVFRPQLGVVHGWGNWSAELTGSPWFFTDNDEFFGGQLREQDPFYTLQTQLVYSFRPGLWMAASAGYGIGAESKIDGVRQDDENENIVWALSLGFPLPKHVAGKIAYIGSETLVSTGADSDTISLAIVVNW